MANYFQPMNAYSAYPNQFQFQQPQALYQVQQPMSAQGSQNSPTMQTNASQGIIWVQGEAGAKSYLVAPGQSILLMDSESSTFYIKSSDSSGMPLPLRIFEYQEKTANTQQVPPVQESQQIDMSHFVTHEEFEKFKSEVLSRRNQQAQKPIPKEGS